MNEIRREQPNMISIHALREESDERPCMTRSSTMDFNPRPPRGERPGNHQGRVLVRQISIHALREESDEDSAGKLAEAMKFQSTPSARRATKIGG